MKKILDSPHKNRYLLITALLVLLLIYKLAIKRTLDSYLSANEFRDELALAIHAPEECKKLETEINKLDNYVTGHEHQEQEDELLGMLSAFCDKEQLLLVDLPKPALKQQEQLQVESNKIVVQGSFATLQKLVYSLEHQPQLGKVVSLQYFLRKDPKTAQKVLQAAIYLQRAKRQAS